MLGKVAKFITLHIKINQEDKTWSITSEKMDEPEWQKIDYSDIEEIFKAKPSSYHVEEKRYPDGRFKSFTVDTR